MTRCSKAGIRITTQVQVFSCFFNVLSGGAYIENLGRRDAVRVIASNRFETAFYLVEEIDMFNDLYLFVEKRKGEKGD